MSCKSQEMPLFKKALEIRNTLKCIYETGNKSEIMEETLLMLIGNTFKIMGKISNTESVDCFDKKFENAFIIKVNAQEIYMHTHILRFEEVCDESYIKLLKQEIEEFRLLFHEWVRSFRYNNNFQDEWDITGHFYTVKPDLFD